MRVSSMRETAHSVRRSATRPGSARWRTASRCWATTTTHGRALSADRVARRYDDVLTALASSAE